MKRLLCLFLLIFIIPASHAVPAHSAKQSLNNALVKAINYNYPPLIQKLLAQGADVNARNDIGQTVLEQAAQDGEYDAVKVLLDAGADVNSTSNYGGPLVVAAQGGYVAICRTLLDHGANPNSNNGYNTPLTATLDGLAYDQSENFNAVDFGQEIFVTGVTAIPNTRTSREQIKRMMQQQAAEKERVRLLRKAQLEAVLPNRLQRGMIILHMLLNEGANVNLSLKDARTPLMVAAKAGSVEAVNVLLDHGARSDARTSDHQTVLMFASMSALVSRLLLDRGNDVNAKDDRGYTALLEATMAKNNIEVVKALVEHGADVNARNQSGDTPLFNTETWGDLKVARFLLNHGASVNTKDNNGKTPLALAREYKNSALVSLLKNAGATK